MSSLYKAIYGMAGLGMSTKEVVAILGKQVARRRSQGTTAISYRGSQMGREKVQGGKRFQEDGVGVTTGGNKIKFEFGTP
jgi:hypothetical protein